MAKGVEYRRGNLREALLDRALTVVQRRGAESLSLRELARDVGVSHAAPMRHFSDKNALLDAVALEGFAMLGSRLEAVTAADADPTRRAAETARTFIEFAVTEANLSEIMFRHDDGRDADVIGPGADAALRPIHRVFGGPADETAAVTATVFLATLQGIASLVNCGVVLAADVPALLDDAVPRFLPR
jgi:AcrR family transcriptional regulator